MTSSRTTTAHHQTHQTSTRTTPYKVSCCGGLLNSTLCQRLPWWWCPALVLLIASWGGSYYVHQDCSFVVLSSQEPLEDGDGEVVEIRRGTTRGQLQPDDECQPWDQYDNLTLDTYMKLTVYSATLPLVLGAVIMAILLLIYPCLTVELICLRAFFQWTATFLAIACAVFQALTHFMVPSQMCHESPLIDGQGFSCENHTTAYFATFFTMAGWALVAVLIVDCTCLPCARKCKTPVESSASSSSKHNINPTQEMEETAGDSSISDSSNHHIQQQGQRRQSKRPSSTMFEL